MKTRVRPVTPASPEARVGKTASLVIFLGILYSLINIVALMSAADVEQQWQHAAILILMFGIIGLGYGIRYGKIVCLYLSTGLFLGLAVYFLFFFAVHGGLRPGIRGVLSTWATVVLCRSIPAMRVLKQMNTKPLGMSRYGEFFLRRWRR